MAASQGRASGPQEEGGRRRGLGLGGRVGEERLVLVSRYLCIGYVYYGEDNKYWLHAFTERAYDTDIEMILRN